LRKKKIMKYMRGLRAPEKGPRKARVEGENTGKRPFPGLIGRTKFSKEGEVKKKREQ